MPSTEATPPPEPERAGPPDPLRGPIVAGALGTTFRLYCTDDGLRSSLRRLLTSMHANQATIGSLEVSLARGPRNAIEIRDGGSNLVGSASVGNEVAGVLSYLNALIIDQMDFLGVHAGVVAGSNGAIAFPGRSGDGKSTLTAACLKVGFNYVSDEVLAFSWGLDGPDKAAVYPYPRPLALSPWSAAELGLPAADASAGEVYVNATDLGTTVHTEPTTLRHIVFLGPITGRARLIEATRQQAAAALLERSFNGWRHPSEAFARSHSIAAVISCWLLERGDPMECAELLHERLNAEDA